MRFFGIPRGQSWNSSRATVPGWAYEHRRRGSVLLVRKKLATVAKMLRCDQLSCLAVLGGEVPKKPDRKLLNLGPCIASK